MRIAVAGDQLQSYVAATLFASVGNQVFFFNDSKEDVDILKEPGLASVYQSQLTSERLKYFSTEHAKELNIVFDFVVLADINPYEFVEQYQAVLNNTIDRESCFIILTPSEIGESSQFARKLKRLFDNENVCSIPMLHREGQALEDFSRPDSLVVGSDRVVNFSKVESLFYPFNRVKNIIRRVSSKEAEFASFATNAMLATRLSFMNEMAVLAERNDIDIDVVRECIGSDPRIGRDYLYPGCGYGGKALAENVDKIAQKFHQFTDNLGMLDTVARINDRQKDLLFRKIWRYFETELTDKTIAIWGASFKPKTASIEGAPAVRLIESLLAQSANIRVYDPLALDNLKKHFSYSKQVKYCHSAIESIQGADVLAICTEWKEFWNPDLDLVKQTLNYPAIFDGRNILSPKSVKQQGLCYFGVGRGEKI